MELMVVFSGEGVAIDQHVCDLIYECCPSDEHRRQLADGPSADRREIDLMPGRLCSHGTFSQGFNLEAHLEHAELLRVLQPVNARVHRD